MVDGTPVVGEVVVPEATVLADNSAPAVCVDTVPAVGEAAVPNASVLADNAGPLNVVQYGAAALENDLNSIAQMLTEAGLTGSHADFAVWKLQTNGVYTVASCYHFLCSHFVPFGPANRYDSAFIDIWKIDVPLKVKAFGWRCFINKVPTKDSLLFKGIIAYTSNLDCVFCADCNESLLYSFLSCRNAGIVWREMAEWIGLPFKIGLDFKEGFIYWSSFCRSKKVKSAKVGTVWLAILWSLWMRRNDIVFNNGSWNSRDVVWSFSIGL
ncbi:uncharacterized protein LOC131648617 [Vicia villosa]|uniref:uncharacterized protein LOC131648617 n=1 Tax=Vicia villosa TaxID=3911 RepID=UPI00273CAD35|nr:uncharacterized protein LOC131648617 [Vicia villosa]